MVGEYNHFKKNKKGHLSEYYRQMAYSPDFSWTLCQLCYGYLTTAHSTNCRWCQIHTMFTKGQPRRRHLPQYFGSKHSKLWSTAKNFEYDTARTDQKSGL